MALRLSDTAKWEDPAFRSLAPELKALYFWMLETWPHHGVRVLDLGLCSFQVGFQVGRDHIVRTGHKLFTNGTKFFFPSFVLGNQGVSSFGELNPANNAHKGILRAIVSERLTELCEALDDGEASPSLAPWMPLTSPSLAPSEGLTSPTSNSNSNSHSSSSNTPKTTELRYTREQSQKPQGGHDDGEQQRTGGHDPHGHDGHPAGHGAAEHGHGHAPVAEGGAGPQGEANCPAGTHGAADAGDAQDHERAIASHGGELGAGAANPAGGVDRPGGAGGVPGGMDTPQVQNLNVHGGPDATTTAFAPPDGVAVGQQTANRGAGTAQAIHPTQGIRGMEIVAQGAESGRRKRKCDLGEPNDPDFHRWWAEYPRKDAKIPAFLAWEGNRRHMRSIDDMIDVLKRQIAANDWGSCENRRRFTPLPASYLNARRWNDEPPPRAPTFEEQMEASLEEINARHRALGAKC